MIEIIHGDCLEEMKKMPDNSVDSIVTDPPYGLSFMGKKWDYDVPSQEIWEECLRVLKPGGYLLSFAGTRTQHRMAVRIEDAGFEIRDMIAWIYGSGFPKSLNVGKAVDKLQGNEREYVGPNPANRPYNLTKGETSTGWQSPPRPDKDKGTSPWEGWGTALKPALEPITVARKPLSEKTVAQNVLTHGTGGLNIDQCRVGTEGGGTHCDNRDESGKCLGHRNAGRSTSGETFHGPGTQGGRFPANLITDGSDEVVGLFPYSKNPSGSLASRGATGVDDNSISHSAARFFYCAKASKKDRDEGLEGFETRSAGEVTGGREEGSAGLNSPRAGAVRTGGSKNFHPTVKPTDLMRYLCRLVTPKGGTVLDPFMGSGSTGKAARLEGFDFIGIEKDKDYYKIAQKRIHDSSN